MTDATILPERGAGGCLRWVLGLLVAVDLGLLASISVYAALR